jgi:potassium-transporting ATPase KdpC subunit
MLRRQLLTGLLMTVVMTVLVGLAYPLAVLGVSQVFMKGKANGSLVEADGKVVGSSLIGQPFLDKNGDPLPQYFQPRPSAVGYSSEVASGGSNYGPSNANLIGNVPGVAYDRAGHQLETNPFATTADPYCVPVPATDDHGNEATDAQGNPVYEKTADGEYVCDPNTIPERTRAYRAFNGLAAGVEVPADAVTASASGLDPQISPANARLQAARVARARGISLERVQEIVDSHTHGRALGFLGEQTVNVLQLNLALDALES